MQEKQIDPRYWTMPLWQQIRELGWGWIKEQDRILEEIAGDEDEEDN